MKRTLVLLFTALLSSVALAGCAADEEEPVETTPTPVETTPTEPTPVEPTPTEPTPTEPTPETPTFQEDTYALATHGIPDFVRQGASFNFTLWVNGTTETASDHVGAHYADDMVDTPDAKTMKGCEHQSGELPGEFTVTCTIEEEGTWFVYGHARVSAGEETFNYWAAPEQVTVIGNYTLTTSLNAGVPTTVALGDTLNFTLTIAGDENVTSDHVGAHFGANSTTEPSVKAYAQACAHQTVAVPGEVTVTCEFAEAGTYYLRGHMRFGSGAEAINFWTDQEYTIIVSPV